MARAGLFKSEVRAARAKLLAQGARPSIDAVRIALGNTGSKTTIHRYLKELDEEEGAGLGSNGAISDALQDLVARLSSRLQNEARELIEASRAQHVDERNTLIGEIEQLKRELSQANGRETELAARLQLRDETIASLQEDQNAKAMRTTQLEQEITALRQRLDEHVAHITSLEEKHQHARIALEHFRTAAKEQREHERRSAEDQIQQLRVDERRLRQTLSEKQEDLVRLNQDNARLTSELAQTRKSIHALQSELKTAKSDLKGLAELSRQLGEMQQHVASLVQVESQIHQQLAEAHRARDALMQSHKQVEIENARLQALVEAMSRSMPDASVRTSADSEQ